MTPLSAHADPTPAPSSPATAKATESPDDPAATTPPPPDTPPTDSPSPEPTSADPTSAEPTSAEPTSAAPTASTPAAKSKRVVPPATGNNAVITVKVGGDRSTTTTVAGLAGVTLQLFDGATAPTTAAIGTGGSNTCVSDADGDCSWTITDTGVGGVNRNRQFWVVQTGVPSGWNQNSSLVTGPDGGPFGPTDYRFRTGTALVAGATYRSGSSFMLGTGNNVATASAGIWQNSRANPSVPTQCGLDVALVLDLSGSVAPNLPQLKTAATSFVNSLVGTPSRVGLFTFAATAPALGANNINRPPTAVSTQAGADTVNAWINGLSAGGTTNWDRGLFQIQQSTAAYDIAWFVTDGNPTVYGNTEGPGGYTRFRETEPGVFSANAVKAEGTRLIAIGVGAGISAGAANLRAISGPTPNSDYFQTTNYAQAAAALRAPALGSCTGSVTVVKQVVPTTAPPGSTTGAVPAGDWTITGDTQATGVSLDAPRTRITESGTGAVNFPVTFTGGVNTGPLTFTETQQSGYTLQPVDGANAVCTRVDTGANLPVTNAGLGFTVQAAEAYPVSCTVYNRAPNPAASVVVNKRWTINGVSVPNGQQPSDFVAQATLNGDPVPFGATQTGFNRNDTAVVDESSVELEGRPGCVLVSSRVTSANGTTIDAALPYRATLTQTANSYEITNVVTCTTTLTLVKQATGGVTPPNLADWTLNATAPAGSIPFAGGSTGVTHPITSDQRYLLSESGGDPAYRQYVDPNATVTPGATGSWTCVSLDAAGDVVPGFTDGLTGGITAPLGARIRCTAVNQTATLKLVKSVTNDNGGTAVPADWNLTATPTGTFPAGLGPVTRAGASQNDAAAFNVRPGTSYALSESGGPAGYTPGDWACIGADIDGDRVTLDSGQDAVCTIVNNDQVARLTLIKEVDPNGSGSTKDPADWTLTATPNPAIPGQDPVSGNGDNTDPGGVDHVAVFAGTYTLSEDGPVGFDPGDWICAGGTQTGTSVAIPTGGDVTCRITNTARAPRLTLVTEVTNDNGGTAVPTDWVLTATGPSSISGAVGDAAVTLAPVQVGTYSLSEDGPDGYDPSTWTCVIAGSTTTGSSVTLAEGDTAVCTIVNNDQPPVWSIVKLSDPPSGSKVRPGDEILYGIILIKNGGVDPTNVVVSDDLSQVLDNATVIQGPNASNGTATITGTTLIWTVPTFSDFELVTYTVRVDDGAYGKTLTNVATSPGSSPCVPGVVARQSARFTGAAAAIVGAQRAAAAREDPCPTTTIHDISSRTPNLPNTGAPSISGAVLGGLFLISGGLLLVGRRRRRTS